MKRSKTTWRALALSAGLVGGVALLARSADHQDSPAIASDAAADVNDVYAFLSPTNSNNLVLVMTVYPFIPPTEAATTYFSQDVLYQFKIDTNGDAIEDLVVQAQFDAPGPDQRFTVFGPARPAALGTLRNTVLEDAASVGGRISTGAAPQIASGNGMTAFAGVREDPFFFDAEQLGAIFGGTASGFRNPGIDTFAGMNTLALVVELPVTMLGGVTNLGIWATTSRP